MPRISAKGPNTDAKSAEPRLAVAVDSKLKERNLLRLRRIEGQVRGLHKMVTEDRYCPDILMQIASVQEALKGVSRELVRNHLSHCARRALRGTDEQAQAAVDELVAVWSKHAG
ncbi:MAG TPA: metal-sensitive transcriptional regulator [Polyangiaceae bacterium]|jgi:DNA-binding FrmR family transcriptional regulator|nr:metal-sensitive transcriptional regulator [Polyangiaceae bacterium]